MVVVTFGGHAVRPLTFTVRAAFVGPHEVSVISPTGERVLIARHVGVAGWRIESSGPQTHRVFPYFSVAQL